MRTWLANKWETLTGSFWFLPAIMTAGAGLLYFVLLRVDALVEIVEGGPVSWLRLGTPDAARVLLSTIVASVVTALSLVFSMTVVALTLAVSQMGPRLLRNFIRNRRNQFVLGVFVATVIYCLLALRAVDRATADRGLPHITLNCAFLLGVASLVVLIYFIHRLARSLQVTNVILDVSGELEKVIDRCFPDRGEAAPAGAPELPEGAGLSVVVERTGYVQAVDESGLLESACRHEIAVECACRAGDLVVEGDELARLYGKDPSDEAQDRVRSAFIMGSRRTATQDPEFVLYELVEIAVRALSPGVNDPFTAINCVDHIAAALCRIAGRSMPPLVLRDQAGRTRVVMDRTSFAGICDAGFEQIRQHARTDVAVTVRLLESLARVARRTRTDPQRDAVRRQARMILRGAQDLPEPLDREEVEKRFAQVEKALETDWTERKREA